MRRVADDADDRDPRGVRRSSARAERDALADRIGVREILLHELLIDHRDRRRVLNRSWSVNTRPFLSGTRSASKNLGDTMRMSPHGPFCPGGTTTPSIVKLDVDHPPPNGMTDVTPAARTPVSELRRGISWFDEQNLRGVGRILHRRQREVERQHVAADRIPGSTPCSLPTLLINSPAPTSSVSDSATSATTSPRRTLRPAKSAAPLRLPSLSVS